MKDREKEKCVEERICPTCQGKGRVSETTYFCPYVHVGDTLTVVDYERIDKDWRIEAREYPERPREKLPTYRLVVDHFGMSANVRGCCSQLKMLALAFDKKGRVANPGNAAEVDCSRCKYK